ncbi:MAG: NUDIX hydrolase [Sphingomonadaceae bacterium]|nr:NUDIX hydrolase [Sphingomonadaceae bacterium]
MTETHREPPVPRPAATLLLVRDDPFEVLMVRRANRGQFASALVFPGGVVEDGDRSKEWLPHLDGADELDPDERALRIAAIRETFEETAILVAENEEGICPPIADATGRGFLDLVREHGLRLRLDAIVPFAHWITPDIAPKRFDTHFYVAKAPHHGEAVCDGAETVALEWANPHEVIERARAGERSILFPTRLNLVRLAESHDAASALAAAAARPHFVVHPWPEKREGGMAVVIPAEAGYAETENFHPSGTGL